MSVRLEGFRVRGFGPFRDEFAVDLTALGDARLVAIVGENGSGKTTFVELALPGAMFRSTPTRGSLVDLATSRDAFLETRLVNGQAWTIRHLVDKVSGKSEALVLDADGAPVLTDSKVRSFDAWAAQHMPAPEVFFASAFAPQGASGFLGAKPAERKEILLRILGPEMQRLETYAAEAREQAKTAKGVLATLEARMADERARGGDVPAITAGLDRGRLLVESMTRDVEGFRTTLTRAEEQARTRAELEKAERDRQATLARLTVELGAARDVLAGLEGRVANNRAVIADAQAIRTAAERLPGLRQQIATKAASLATARAEAEHWRLAAGAELGRETAARQRAQQAEKRLAGAADVAAAAERLPGLREALGHAEGDLAREEESLDAYRAQRVQSADGRIEELRGTLGGIRDLRGGETEQAPEWAGRRLEADDEQVQLAANLPDEIKAQERRVAEYRQRRTAAEQALRTNEQLAARAADVEQARQDLAAAQHESDDAAMAAGHAGEELVEANRARDALDAELQGLQAELGRVEPVAAKATPLEKAEARLAELEPQVVAAKAEIARLDVAIAEVPAPIDLPPEPHVDAARRLVREAEGSLTVAHRAVAQSEQQLEQAMSSRERLFGLESEGLAAEAELADWTRLAADLGRDGLQAMVIDGAIPEINEVTNDLLHQAFGHRWTVDVRTQAADAKGRRLLETLDVCFIDTERGREGLAETLSGGEKTIVAEALSLALTTLACRQAGADRPTLIRDESAGQLSAGNTRAWMAMMRRAADIIGVDRILFVNHNPETWELADARIEVRS